MPASAQAQDRARELLLEYLRPEQRETFQAWGHFDVDKTGARRSLGMLLLAYPRFRVYRLSLGAYPVSLFTSAKRLAASTPSYAYCIHAPSPALKDDELLSLKLLLEHDEAQFVRIAFRMRLFGRDWPLPLGQADLG